ncbi:thiamine phosphate synthase [Sphingomonas soli]|uniref:thiamine phosphate synthase n=1 Tax=Sphingomonas soli TaxID=266127 RepID=UPI0008306F89|nr:thiamine phosphate synthase [Sphingomonas soli]
MPPRHPPLPTLWLMTDERMGDALWDALERLPAGSGVVFRHYGLAPETRQQVFARVSRIARRRRLLLIRAGPGGEHNQRTRTLTASAHSRREAIAAIRAGARLIFVSPIFATRSHPGARPLGRSRLGLMTRGLGVPLVALGGMNARKARSLCQLGMHGWAAIDAWTKKGN